MTDKENQPTGLHRDLFLAISRDISLAIELDLSNKYKKTTNCDNVEHKLLSKITCICDPCVKSLNYLKLCFEALKGAILNCNDYSEDFLTEQESKVLEIGTECMKTYAEATQRKCLPEYK